MAGPTEDPNDQTFADGVTTAAIVEMARLARELLDRLDIDRAEYLADLYCLHHAANLLALRLMRRGHGLTLAGTGPATEACRALRAILDEAYRRAGVLPAADCINLGAAAVQRHPAAAD